MEQTDAVELENWVDEAVLSFVVDMKYKLRLNNHKGHWKEYDESFLLRRMNDEFKELQEACKFLGADPASRNYLSVIHECADVANFAMMIADNAKRLMRLIDGKRT